MNLWEIPVVYQQGQPRLPVKNDGFDTVRRSVWHARLDGAQDAREPEPAARLRHRSTNRAGRTRVAGIESRDDLSGPPAVGAEGLDQKYVGNERQQPACSFLFNHPRGSKAAGNRGRQLGPDGRDGESPARGAFVIGRKRQEGRKRQKGREGQEGREGRKGQSLCLRATSGF